MSHHCRVFTKDLSWYKSDIIIFKSIFLLIFCYRHIGLSKVVIPDLIIVFLIFAHIFLFLFYKLRLHVKKKEMEWWLFVLSFHLHNRKRWLGKRPSAFFAVLRFPTQIWSHPKLQEHFKNKYGATDVGGHDVGSSKTERACFASQETLPKLDCIFVGGGKYLVSY